MELRVPLMAEQRGLDISEHGEIAYAEQVQHQAYNVKTVQNLKWRPSSRLVTLSVQVSVRCALDVIFMVPKEFKEKRVKSSPEVVAFARVLKLVLAGVAPDKRTSVIDDYYAKLIDSKKLDLQQ